MDKNKKTLILIDGHALAFRMFFALERTAMQTTDRQPTWAVYGFFKSVFDLLKNTKINPDAIAVAFDVSRKTFRLEKYEHYKENRESMPDTLRSQLGLIIEGLEALSIPIYTKEGFEGDDIIGTIATKGIEEGFKTYVLTGDRDSFQLVDKEDNVCILIPIKGELVYYDWDKVYEKMGVYPNQVVDLKALMGDSSDNIPGVRGIGPKTASNLLETYKTLDNIYAHIDDLKGALKTKLQDNKETAYLSQFLAQIVKDVDIDFNFKEACLNMPDKDKMIEFFKKVQFFGFIKNIDKILTTFSKDKDKLCVQENIVKFEINQEYRSVQLGMFDKPIENFVGEKIKDIKDYSNEEAVKLACQEKLITIFIKNNSVFMGVKEGASKFTDFNLDDVMKNPEIKKIVFDTKKTLERFPEMQGVVMDLALASYIKEPSRKHDLVNQIQNYLGVIFTIDENGKAFAHYMKKLSDFYEKELNKDELNVLREIEIPLSYVLYGMEKRGVSVDIEYLSALSKDIKDKMLFFQKRIYELAGCEFNLNSPRQISEVLFETLKIKPKKKSKISGTYSTSAKILEELAKDYEIASVILQHRQLNKLLTSYLDSFPKLVAEDNRIHTHFNQMVTNTGRLSSSEPNLQNIPIRTELGNQIRKAFVPKERDLAFILSADYSQIELRLMAHFCEDEALIKAFNNNEDIHSIAASNIFGVDIKDVTKEMRRKAKAVNFGLLYGQTRWGLSAALGIDVDEAQDYIDKYFQTYPKMQIFINSTIMQAHQDGYVTTICGRRRYLNDEMSSRNSKIREFAHRAAINAPLQGSAADLIKLAMIDLDKKLQNYKSKLILQVHDELVLEVYKDELEEVKELVKTSMELNQPLKVPLVVDFKMGESWRDE